MKLAVVQVVEKICAFYGNLTFVAPFKRAGKWFLLEVDIAVWTFPFYRNSKNYVVFTLQKARRKPNFAQVGTDCTLDQIQGDPVEIHFATHLNRNDGKMTAR